MAINSAAIEAGADRLFSLFENGGQTDGLPDACAGLSLADGYAIQKSLLARLTGDIESARVGYKIGATNAIARQLLNADHPFHGSLLADRCYRSPAVLDSARLNKLAVEPELALVLGADLPAGVDPHTADSVAAAVAQVVPALEIVDSRFAAWTEVGLPSLVADNGVNAFWIEGTARPLAAMDLTAQQVSVTRNGVAEHDGVGGNVDGGPLGVLAWLANMLNRQGEMLKKGQKISTGTLTPVIAAAPGDTLEADFGVLGTVAVSFR